MKTRILLVALFAPIASLSAQSGGAPVDCQPVAMDSARFGRAPVYAACQVQAPAKLKRNSKPRAEYPTGVRCLIAELEFVVDETGAPVASTAVVTFATTPAYGAAVLQRISQWRYAPAVRDGVPVRQLVVGRLAMQDDSRAPFVVVRPGEPTPSRAPAALCQ